LNTKNLQFLNQCSPLLDRINPGPSPSRVRRLALDSDDKLGITKTRDMEHLYPAVCGNTIIDILRDHMLVHKIVDTGVPAYLLVRGKSRNNRPPELYTGFHQRFQRIDRARV